MTRGSSASTNPAAALWDIFCAVIDNHGDLGVCWRLAQDLVRHGQRVRLWVDDASALAWMAPGTAVADCIDPGAALQVLPWRDGALAVDCPGAGDVLVEAFGCNPPPDIVGAYAAAPHPVAWINLEYLSAEGFVRRQHGLPSPVFHGPGAGLTKRFFHPGFTAGTGGLIGEPGLRARQRGFDRREWRKRHGVQEGERVVSLFCYEPPALPALLRELAAEPAPVRLLATAGRAAEATRAALAALDAAIPRWNAAATLRIGWLPLLPQDAFDELLWAADLNFVRGEDSLARAILAGRPFVWQLYPQDDGAHLTKLQAFSAVLSDAGAGTDWLQALDAWNAAGSPSRVLTRPLSATLHSWRRPALRLRRKIAALGSLTPALIDFARAHPARTPPS